MGLAGHSVFNNYQELYLEVLKLGVLSVKTTGNLFFDVPVSVHGTNSLPITTNLAINPANAIEGATVEVIWQGSVNPNITGVSASDILNIGETITTQGIYSIFIIYTGGKYKVNIQSPVAYVGDGDALPDPEDIPTIIHGCTDPNAENYNPNATVDNGSCTYADDRPNPPTGLTLTEEESASAVENAPTNLVLTEEEI